ncbi:DnaJ domain-containing protein [Halorarum salinum]|uniref:DnaJ domain-containing protein n=1 Tax=Halorarum salinum TaxID=2743089 RepID=A0A7D5QM42_9EURY|nr:DnaJ domain-containing protein [Halobaculum salinum]QLG63205.1 DnaJ domain-containing protein [Halobaculum salinum]
MTALDWPDGFPRTPAGERTSYPGGFEVSRATAFDSILEELEKLEAANPRIETAAPHTAKHPHRPYADRDPEDPGVVAYYDKDGQGFAVACDRWDNLRDNARAVALYIDAKRAIDRYGVSTVGSEFQTQALPSGDEDDVVVAGSGEVAAPHEVLGVSPDAPDNVVKAVARRLSADVHPDSDSPDVEKYKQVQRAKEVMLDA